jgi:hypothetical protein
MRRKAFDMIVSAGGAVVVVILLVAGALGMWAWNYASSTVRTQLAAQEIYFPTKAEFAHARPGTEITPGMIPYLEQYAGQEVLNGQEAAAFANHFIAVHLSEMPYHGVYSQISAAARTNPKNAKLSALDQTSFQGTTLRGLLLEANGFWTFGQIAFWASIASFVLAGIMAILVGMGLWHARRSSEDQELLHMSGRKEQLSSEAA